MEDARSSLFLTRRQGLSLGLALAMGQTQTHLSDTAPLPPPDQDLEGPRLLQNLLTRVAVEVNLPRSQTRLFVLDTGAERTSLSEPLVQRLGLEAGPPVLVHGITGSQITPTARLPFLDLPPFKFTDLLLPVFSHHLLAADGLLGLDILSHFRLTLDLKNRRATIGASRETSLAPGVGAGRASRLRQTVSLSNQRRAGQLFMSQIRVGNVPATGFVDSGAQHSIGNMALMRALDLSRPQGPRGQVRVYGVIGQSLLAEADRVDQLRVSRWDLGPTPLLFADIHAFSVLGLNDRPALLLGTDILSRFNRITLDYGRGLIGFGGLRPPEQRA